MDGFGPPPPEKVIGSDERISDRVTSDTQIKLQYSQASLKEKLRISEETCNRLRITLDASQKLIRELENKISALEASASASAELLKVQNDQKLPELERKLKTKKESFSAIQKQLQDMKEEYNVATAIRESFFQEHKNQYFKHLQQLQDQLLKVIEESNSVELRLMGEIDELTTKIVANKAMHEESLMEFSNVNDKRAIEIVMLQERTKHLESKLADEKGKYESEKGTIAQLKKEIGVKETVIATLSKDLEISKHKKLELDRQIEMLKTEMEHLLQQTENSKRQENFVNKFENCRQELQNTQLSRYPQREACAMLEGKLEELGEACTMLEGILEELEKEVASYQTNQKSLNSNTEKLIGKLAQARGSNNPAQQNIDELNDALFKANETIDQQTKLIDFLQSKMEEPKKMKTLSDKFFGQSKKQNNPPISPCTKRTLEKLAQSPSAQNFSCRMHHNIPHRFQSKLCIKPTKCTRCSDQIILGRNMKYCTECHAAAHPICAKWLPKTCGVPQAYVKHYSDSLMKLTNSSAEDVSHNKENVPETVNIEG